MRDNSLNTVAASMGSLLSLEVERRLASRAALS
jgi:hypothetical protein